MSTLIQKMHVPFARFALFTIYFWFGILKALGLSPAGPLVRALFDETIHFMSFDIFYLSFAVFEMLIGVLFLIPRFSKLAFLLFVLHIVMTTLPLFILPELVWQSAFVPTLEGQYIIKNLALVAIALTVLSTHARHGYE